METKILQGMKLQERIFMQVRQEVELIRINCGEVPGIVFIGFEGVALAKYTVPMHIKAASDAGFRVYHEMCPAGVTFDALSAVIGRYNEDRGVHAIVILQPVPGHLDPMLTENAIVPAKEVEGFHPQNMLGTMVPGIAANPYPMCLPEALHRIFLEEGVSVRKDDAWVFVLDDEFFTNPLTHMIVRTAAAKAVPKDSPLTIINRTSGKLVGHVRSADFLVVVSKTPCYVDPEWLKPGVTIIDIYSNLVKEVPSKNDPSRMVPVIRGGVSVEAVRGIASGILPVPGGLMTVVLALLLMNTVTAFRRSAAPGK